MKIEIFNHDKSQAGNIGDNDEKEDEGKIYIFIVNTYFYVVAMTCMH